MIQYWALHQPGGVEVTLIAQMTSTWFELANIATFDCDEISGTTLSAEALAQLAEHGWSPLSPTNAQRTPMGWGTRIEPDGFATHFLSVDYGTTKTSCVVLLRAMRYDGTYVDLHVMDDGLAPVACEGIEGFLGRIDNRMNGKGWSFGAPWLYADWRREGDVEVTTYERIVLRDPAARCMEVPAHVDQRAMQVRA